MDSFLDVNRIIVHCILHGVCTVTGILQSVALQGSMHTRGTSIEAIVNGCFQSLLDPSCVVTLGAGSPATGRLTELLQKLLSPPAAADVLASMLTRDTAFKQLVLEAVDHNERMRLVVGLLRQVH